MAGKIVTTLRGAAWMLSNLPREEREALARAALRGIERAGEMLARVAKRTREDMEHDAKRAAHE